MEITAKTSLNLLKQKKQIGGNIRIFLKRPITIALNTSIIKRTSFSPVVVGSETVYESPALNKFVNKAIIPSEINYVLVRLNKNLHSVTVS